MFVHSKIVQPCMALLIFPKWAGGTSVVGHLMVCVGSLIVAGGTGGKPV